MNSLQYYNKFESLNEYIKHEQYKFIYTHPLFLKYGNKHGLNFICDKENLNILKYHISFLLISFISMVISISYNNIILTGVFSLSTFLTFSYAISKFIFTRSRLWKKLEKRFLDENISSNNISNMFTFLTIEQKEAILEFLKLEDTITFNQLIKMFECLNNKIEKEKIILALNK